MSCTLTFRLTSLSSSGNRAQDFRVFRIPSYDSSKKSNYSGKHLSIYFLSKFDYALYFDMLVIVCIIFSILAKICGQVSIEDVGTKALLQDKLVPVIRSWLAALV